MCKSFGIYSSSLWDFYILSSFFVIGIHRILMILIDPVNHDDNDRCLKDCLIMVYHADIQAPFQAPLECRHDWFDQYLSSQDFPCSGIGLFRSSHLFANTFHILGNSAAGFKATFIFSTCLTSVHSFWIHLRCHSGRLRFNDVYV